VVLNWGPRYAQRTQQAIDGTWASELVGTLCRGRGAARIRESVPDDVREVDEQLAGFEAARSSQLVGPISDQAGGCGLQREEIPSAVVNWDWLVQGVGGSLPS
jgi:hypothetical protein